MVEFLSVFWGGAVFHREMELNMKNVFAVQPTISASVTGKMGSAEALKTQGLLSFFHIASIEVSSSLPQTPPDFGNLLAAV